MAAIHQAIYEKNVDVLMNEVKTNASLKSLINIGMQLRKCCNHPFLLEGVEDAETAELSNDNE